MKLTFLILLFPFLLNAQIGVGLGKLSNGKTSAKMCFTTPSGFGSYITHYADAKNYVEGNTTGFQYSEERATMIGLSGKIHSLVIVYVGAGGWYKCIAYNDANHYRYYEKSKGSCFEVGAQMQVLKYRMFLLSVDASMNTVGQMNTMLIFSVKSINK